MHGLSGFVIAQVGAVTVLDYPTNESAGYGREEEPAGERNQEEEEREKRDPRPSHGATQTGMWNTKRLSATRTTATTHIPQPKKYMNSTDESVDRSGEEHVTF